MTNRSSDQFRVECDFLGEVLVPAGRYFGAETARALENFPMTGIGIGAMPELVKSLAWIKKAAAQTNRDAGDLTAEQCHAVVWACDEILGGDWNDEFVVDVIQGGAGTSSNMNANEVIANRALELMGHARGEYEHLHPKDHINKCQSTNDVYASAIRLTVVQLNRKLSHAVSRCAEVFAAKSDEFAHVSKIGRTQLQDAVPMTVGQEFGGYAAALNEDIERIAELDQLFLEVNLGGSAIGTGIGVSDYYMANIVPNLGRVSGLDVVEAKNRLEASWDTGIFVLYSGMLKRLASKVSKIANDLRLLSSGPVGGFGEIRLPQRQPGSSIMPGKVNPVIPEVVNQACFRIFGADTTVTFASEAGQLQLNAMEPVIIWTIYDSATVLIAALNSFVDNCISGIEVDERRCSQLLDASTARVTDLAVKVGYAKAAEVAKLMTASKMAFADAVALVVPDQAEVLLAELAH